MIAAAARLVALPRVERSRLVEAACYLLIARVAFGLLPFPQALCLLRIAPADSDAEGSGAGAAEAAAVGRAIVRVARHVPFRAVCLQQGFAALLMLRRRGLPARVHLGAARPAGSTTLAAHAWSYSGDVPVTGAEHAAGFAPVAVFTA